MLSLLERQQTFARNVCKLIECIFVSGYACTLGEAERSKEQAEIYAKEGLGIVDSQHCKRLAIDLNIFTVDGTYVKDAAVYKKFGDYWRTLDKDNQWGGCFKRVDSDHFEMK